jgi:MFS transporter, FSR family, fosmidomycin resistance protein
MERNFRAEKQRRQKPWPAWPGLSQPAVPANACRKEENVKEKLHFSVYYLALGHLAVDWAQGAIPALLPFFIQTYHLSYEKAAFVVFVNLLVASVTQPFLGYYADRFSKPWLVPVGPILCGICVSSVAFTSSYYAILAAVLLGGLGSALYHPEAALMVNHVAGRQKGRALGLFSVGGNAGFAIGPMVAGLAAYQFGIHWLLVFLVVNLSLALALYLHMPAILAKAAESQEVEKKEHPGYEPRNDWKSFGKLLFPICARSMGFTLSNTFIPMFWITILMTSATQGTAALTILFTLGAFLTYIGGIVSDRIGFVKMLRLAMLIMVPSFFFLTRTTQVWLATALLVPIAMSLFMGYSSIVGLGQQYLAKNMGFASGVTLGLTTTVGGLMAPFVGRLADQYGLVAALQVLWIAGLIGAIAAFTLPADKKEPQVYVLKK